MTTSEHLCELVSLAGKKVTDPCWKVLRTEDFINLVSNGEQVLVNENIVDLDVGPFVPYGWTVVEGEHKPGGKWPFNPKQVELYLSPNQIGNKTIVGNELRKELVNVPVMNANLLDWYLAHQGFIPEEWKGKGISFWGTIYCNFGGHLCVRHLWWDGVKWDWFYFRLDKGWNSNAPALVLQVNA